MKIDVERSGGFSGISSRHIIDSNKIPSTELKHLQELLKYTNDKKLESQRQKSKGADYFQYNIIIEDKGQKVTIKTDELTTDPQLRSLIDFLETKI